MSTNDKIYIEEFTEVEDEQIECSCCEELFNPRDLERHNGICHKCYCEKEFSAYADGQPCDADAVKELL